MEKQKRKYDVSKLFRMTMDEGKELHKKASAADQRVAKPASSRIKQIIGSCLLVDRSLYIRRGYGS